MYGFISLAKIPGGFKTVTLASDAALSLTDAGVEIKKSSQPANGALITCETQAIRYTYDGTTPVAGSVGHVLFAGQALRLEDVDVIQNFEFCNAVAGANGTIQITIEYPSKQGF